MLQHHVKNIMLCPASCKLPKVFRLWMHPAASKLELRSCYGAMPSNMAVVQDLCTLLLQAILLIESLAYTGSGSAFAQLKVKHLDLELVCFCMSAASQCISTALSVSHIMHLHKETVSLFHRCSDVATRQFENFCLNFPGPNRFHWCGHTHRCISS